MVRHQSTLCDALYTRAQSKLLSFFGYYERNIVIFLKYIYIYENLVVILGGIAAVWRYDNDILDVVAYGVLYS